MNNRQIDLLHNWLDSSKIKHSFVHELIFVTDDGKHFLLIPHKQEKVFNPKMSLILNDDDLNLLDFHPIDYFVTLFGDKFYYFGEDDFKVEQIFDEVGDVVGENMHIKDMHELRYIGTSIEGEVDIFPHLGVHGGYDLCNGSRLYKDWCRKANWLGVKTLGICEENTLAGTLLFQAACEKANINSIIGETINIKHKDNVEYQIKLYCINEIGWRNLLQINTLVNTSLSKSITVDQLKKLTTGLICILTPTIQLTDAIVNTYLGLFDEIFYQLDFVEWNNNVKEEDWRNNISTYLVNFCDLISPIALFDSYYIEEQDADIQPILWRIGKREGFKYRSKDRYFKTSQQWFDQASSLFDLRSDKACVILLTAMDNAYLFNDISFKIPVGQKHLPKYELTPQQQIDFADSDELFWHLIEKGLEQKVINKHLDVEVYLQRIQEEVRVIELGQVKDYFLIVWDILNFCNDNEIITGIGRGSAAGCLVSYLLGIVQIDPIQYELLFERFLNEGRVGKSLPDIDNDIAGSRRDEVKRYIEQRYGEDYVAAIGTYGTFKIRAALKDLVREIGGDGREANYISAIIDGEDKFIDLFSKALDPNVNVRLYQFIKKHSFQINHIPQLFHQPKTQSVHAAGVIIVPKHNGPIYQQLPVKKMDGIVVTEWEGNQIEEAGFLKVDILGLKQLDKFDEIIRLIKNNRGEQIILNDIPLNVPGVYHFFQKGFNEDIFQFGGGGLKTYCKMLRPDNIEDLIATVALYRPGPIEINAHEKYAKIKNGELDLKYYFGLEQITKPTYSQIVYQEQIMKIVQELGGFSLVEADDVRKAMGKKLPEVMAKYKQQFLNGAIERGCPSDEALQIWMDMEGFAGYAFNRSHAACYGITGYYSQWFKYSYPLEFWLICLKYSKDDEIQNRIAEIKHIAEGITIQGPDILMSQRDYFGDVHTNTIYWSLNSVKHVAEAALKEIERLRTTHAIIDFENFVSVLNEDKEERRKKMKLGERLHSPINRRVIVHLIIAGAFDKLERLSNPAKRGELLIKYFELLHPELKLDPHRQDEKKWRDRMGDYYDLTLFTQDYKWIMEQRRLCGFGTVDFRGLLSKLPYKNTGLFKSNNEILLLPSESEKVIVGGVVESVVIRKSRNGSFAQVLLHDGYAQLYVTIWAEIFQEKAEEITNCQGKLLFIDGEMKMDGYRKINVVHSKSYSTLEILQ